MTHWYVLRTIRTYKNYKLKICNILYFAPLDCVEKIMIIVQLIKKLTERGIYWYVVRTIRAYEYYKLKICNI